MESKDTLSKDPQEVENRRTIKKVSSLENNPQTTGVHQVCHCTFPLMRKTSTPGSVFTVILDQHHMHHANMLHCMLALPPSGDMSWHTFDASKNGSVVRWHRHSVTEAHGANAPHDKSREEEGEGEGGSRGNEVLSVLMRILAPLCTTLYICVWVCVLYARMLCQVMYTDNQYSWV